MPVVYVGPTGSLRWPYQDRLPASVQVLPTSRKRATAVLTRTFYESFCQRRASLKRIATAILGAPTPAKPPVSITDERPAETFPAGLAFFDPKAHESGAPGLPVAVIPDEKDGETPGPDVRADYGTEV